MTKSLSESAALSAVDLIIDDFGHHRREAYFDGFAADATFIFHSFDLRLESRQEYETLWKSWEEAGFRVRRCDSTNRRIQLFGEVAVFSHDVETESQIAGVTDVTRERETIVLELRAGRWLGVHEHLSSAGQQ